MRLDLLGALAVGMWEEGVDVLCLDQIGDAPHVGIALGSGDWFFEALFDFLDRLLIFGLLLGGGRNNLHGRAASGL